MIKFYNFILQGVPPFLVGAAIGYAFEHQVILAYAFGFMSTLKPPRLQEKTAPQAPSVNP